MPAKIARLGLFSRFARLFRTMYATLIGARFDEMALRFDQISHHTASRSDHIGQLMAARSDHIGQLMAARFDRVGHLVEWEFKEHRRHELATGSISFITQDSIARLNSGPPKAEPAIAVVAPMPPAKTGVAWYTFSSLRAADYGVDIYAAYETVDQYVNAIHDPRLANSNIRIFSADTLPLGRMKNRYKAQVFIIGNSNHNIHVGCALWHLAEFPVDLQTFVYIHDPCLLNIINQLCWKFEIDFTDLLHRHYAEKIFSAPKNLDFNDQGALAKRSIFGPKALLSDIRVDGVIVNSQAAAEIVRRDFVEFNTVNIHELFLPVFPLTVTCAIPRTNLRIRIGTFGVPAESKCTDVIVRAFRELRSKQPNVELLIAGYNARNFGAKMGLLNERNIFIETSPTTSRLAALMHSCDIAVQLRADSLGESSGIVPQLLALGTPTIVSRDGSFSEYGDAVAYAPRNISPDQLADLILWEVKAKTRRTAAVENYVAQHNSALFCKQLMAIIEASKLPEAEAMRSVAGDGIRSGRTASIKPSSR